MKKSVLITSLITVVVAIIFLWPQRRSQPEKKEAIERAYQFLLSSLEHKNAISTIDCVIDEPFHKTGEQGDIVLSSVFLQALSRVEKISGKLPSKQRSDLVD